MEQVTVTAGTVFLPSAWPKRTWLQRRMQALKLGIDLDVGEGEVEIDGETLIVKEERSDGC